MNWVVARRLLSVLNSSLLQPDPILENVRFLIFAFCHLFLNGLAITSALHGDSACMSVRETE